MEDRRALHHVDSALANALEANHRMEARPSELEARAMASEEQHRTMLSKHLSHFSACQNAVKKGIRNWSAERDQEREWMVERLRHLESQNEGATFKP